MKLRPLQETAINNLRAAFLAGKRRALLVAPCGFGKSVVIAAVTSSHLRTPANRVLIIVHRRELVQQQVKRLRAMGIADVGVLQADAESNHSARVVVASLQTMLARDVRPAATLVVWDECHHCPAASFRVVYASYAQALHLGLTATPMRADGKCLGDMFEVMVVGTSIRELTDAGLLVPSEVLVFHNDTTKDLAADPVEAYQRHTPGRPAIVFCASVASAHERAQRFNEAGIRAACVDGTTESDVRDDVLQKFTDGSLDVITNCFVLTEGFDAPRAEVCILERSPEHVGTYLQMVGRVLRTHEGKTKATVLDLRGAAFINGLPDEDRKWSLDGKPCLRTETMTALRRCKECLAIFRPTRTCPRCGAAHEVVENIPRVLKRAEKVERLNDVPQAERDRRYLWRLISIAKTRMRMTQSRAEWWAIRTFEKQKGRKPEVAA